MRKRELKISDYEYYLYKEDTTSNEIWYLESLVDEKLEFTNNFKNSLRITFAKANTINRQQFNNNFDIGKIRKAKNS